MDGTTATIVVLIFVFSIIGGVTGKHTVVTGSGGTGYSQPQDDGKIYTKADGLEPVIDFTPVNSELLNSSLKNFISGYSKRLDDGEAQAMADSLVKYSQIYNVNPKLVCALISRESGFNRFAVSSSGAEGLGQLLPSTAQGLGVEDPFDIDQNIKGTTRYIKSLLDRFSGDQKVTFALAGYLEGPNIVNRRQGFKSTSKKYIEDIYRNCARIN